MTVTEDVEREVKRLKSSALGRRGRTKTAKTKWRFVVAVDDEPKRPTPKDDVEGDDSFVASAGVRKRKRRDVEEQDRGTHDEKISVRHDDDTGQRPQTMAKRGPGKSKGNKTAQNMTEVMMAAEDTEVADVKPPIESKQKRKPKGRAPKKIEIEATTAVAEVAPEQRPEQAVSAIHRAQRTQSRSRQTTNAGNKFVPDLASYGPPEQMSQSVHEMEPQQALKKSRPRPKAAVHGVEEPPSVAEHREGLKSLGPENAVQLKSSPHASTKRTRAKKDLSAQDQKFSVPAPRKRAISVLNEDSHADHDGAAPTKGMSRTVAKSNVETKGELASTPPHLAKRPLQQADANRSPSPRKSPEKPVNNPRALGGAPGKGKMRKRPEVTRHKDPAEKVPRKGRKLRMDRNAEEAEAEAVLEVEKHLSRPEGQQTPLAVPSQQLAETQKSSEAQSSTKAQPATTSRKSSQLRAKAKAADEDENEEDVDWLFAAPERKNKATVPTPAPTKASTTSRKTKLADIDLDDLIANVAAFAQSGKPENVSLSKVTGGHRRKPRRR